jgi:hypothetical protein
VRSGTSDPRTRRRYLIAILVAVGVLAAAGPAAAQTNQNPRPKKLWDAYPLAPGDETAEPADPAPTPTPVSSAAPSRPIVATAPDSGGGGLPTAVALGGAVLACGVGTAAGATLSRRRRRRAFPAPVTQPTRPRGRPAGQQAARPEPASARPQPASARPEPAAAPRAPAASWWPPTATAAPRADVDLVPADRFARRRPWPEGASGVWTCEVEWKSGYRKSTFRAMAAAPGARRRKLIAESAPVMWTLMGEPDPPTPEKVAVLRELIDALADQGWERIECAGPWFAQRLVWRHTEQPRPIGPLTGKATDA